MNDEELNNENEVVNNEDDKCQEYLLGWKRAMADYENLKRETEKKLANSYQNAEINFIKRLLPILDHYNLALEHLPTEQQAQEWAKGFGHIKDELANLLKGLNVEQIATIGEEFNPLFHEAVAYEDSAMPDNEIIKELKAGYLIGEEVIQPAQVVVAKNHQE